MNDGAQKRWTGRAQPDEIFSAMQGVLQVLIGATPHG